LNLQLEVINDSLEELLDKNRQTIRRYRGRLENHSRILIDDARAYLQLKKISNTDRRIMTVKALVDQVSDPEQNLQRIKDISRRVWNVEYNQQLAIPLKLLNTGTASEVFLTETNGQIGNSISRFGYAKKAVPKGVPPNPTTENLGILQGESLEGGMVLLNPPKLIARQVLSYRLNRKLGFNVIAVESFSTDTDGKTIGITAKANGKQLMKSQSVPAFSYPILNTEGGIDKIEVADALQIHAHIDFSRAEIQKNLSDLQLIDAITGQMDRHLGNIFIDEATGQVIGIDNDMAFPIDKLLPLTDNTLELFARVDGRLVYLPSQIDRDSAQRILDLTEEDLIDLLKGNDGDPERLNQDVDQAAIEHALTRLRAIKERIVELRDAGRLIGDQIQWGDITYDDTIENGTSQIGGKVVEHNYLARSVFAFEKAGDPSNPARRQEGQGM
jgi:hypothetical protein